MAILGLTYWHVGLNQWAVTTGTLNPEPIQGTLDSRWRISTKPPHPYSTMVTTPSYQLVAAAAICVLGIYIGQSVTSRLVGATDYRHAVQSLESTLSEEEEESVPEAHPLRTRQQMYELAGLEASKYKRVCGHLARCVKAKMGLPKQTEANRMVALELITKELETMGVRKSERSKFIPLAVIMVFIPTEYDVMSRRVGLSVEARDRTKRMSEGTDTWIDWVLKAAGFGRGRGVQFNDPN